jgi:hypothetical protein
MVTLLLTAARLTFPAAAVAQDAAARWATWTALQAVPSPIFTDDRGPCGGRLVPALQWHITPASFSFSANPLVSPFSILMVNPVRRYGGSVELFIQPEWALDGFAHADLDRLTVALGARGYVPVDEFGEYLSLSAGGSVLVRRSPGGTARNAAAVEAGVHTLYGILGFQVRYQFVSDSRYSIGLVLRYY